MAQAVITQNILLPKKHSAQYLRSLLADAPVGLSVVAVSSTVKLFRGLPTEFPCHDLTFTWHHSLFSKWDSGFLVLLQEPAGYQHSKYQELLKQADSSEATVWLIKAADTDASADKKQLSTGLSPRRSQLYGCWNGTRAATYIARDGYDVSEDWSATCATGPVRFVNIEDSMSKDCKYDLADTDARCVGCKKSPLLPEYVSQGEPK